MSDPFFWGVVVPVNRTNVEDNPSFELGTAGWAGTASATLGTVSGTAAFGAWALRITGASDGAGATASVTLGGGTAWTASAYVAIYGATGGSAQVNLGGTSTRVAVGTDWRRVSVGTTPGAGASYTIAVQRFGANAGTLLVDGVQVEAGSVTTYIDGDQEGCQWAGVAHASRSVRGADTRAGGSVVPLAAIGLRPETTPGYGVAPTVNQIQDYAIVDGGEYQRTRYEVRPLTITATLTGTTTPDLHRTRRRVIDVLKAGRTPTPAPARLYYWGAGGTVTGDFLYSDGLDGSGENVISEAVSVRLVAPDPAWSDALDQGTTLAPYTVLGSTNYIAYRDPVGRWGTMQTNGTSVALYTPAVSVQGLAAAGGTLFVVGQFYAAGGTPAHFVAQWANGAWGTLTGGQIGTTVATYLARRVTSIAGTVIVAGNFITVAGTQAISVARWSGAWGTLTGGTLGAGGAAVVYDVEPDPTGGVIVAGTFDGVAGTSTRSIARWDGAWGTLNGGTVVGEVLAVDVTSNGSVFGVGTVVGVAGAAALPSRPFYWDGTTLGTVPGTVPTAFLSAIAITPGQQIVTGGFVNQGTPMASRVRAAIGTIDGLIASANAAQITNLYADADGRVYAAGNRLRVLSGYDLPLDVAVWNGYSWLPPDLIVSGVVRAVTRDALGTLYVGGGFVGVGTAAAVAAVVNRGMADSYPVLRVRHTGAGTARVYQLLNTTTGDEIYFNLVMVPGETATLDLRPESLGFTSTVKGTIISSVLGGSNLSTWRLAPGTNTVSFFADNAGITADLYWRSRHLSVDGGADATL